jgi:hypothetical protein
MVLTALCDARTIEAQAFDCVESVKIRVSRIRGQLFDPTGETLGQVPLSLNCESGQSLQTKTGFHGRFNFKAPAARCTFSVEFDHLEAPNTELIVRRDLWTVLRPSHIRVILGRQPSLCASVTTNERQFQNVVRENGQRIQEWMEKSAQQHATQR